MRRLGVDRIETVRKFPGKLKKKTKRSKPGSIERLHKERDHARKLTFQGEKARIRASRLVNAQIPFLPNAPFHFIKKK